MFICDFHIHSKFSRATSKDMDIDNLSKWAKIKGVNLLGTGDFTHPLWFIELKNKLKPCEYGIYSNDGIYYMLTAEVSNIYFKLDRTHKIHNILFAPSFEVASEINKTLAEYGNLHVDGRPILNLDCARMVKKLRSISEDIIIVPAHAWTPHFSIFGENSGFDSLEQCFEDETAYIYSIETGLSSDPAMNWRWSKLDKCCLISNSDSHSPRKIAREANVFKEKVGYKELIDIFKTKDNKKFLYTIEFFPEEGKYHWDGHRLCNKRVSPKEARELNNICPVCGRKFTIGVMHRVEELSDREEGFIPQNYIPYKNFVPLCEIIASVFNVGPDTMTVENEYNKLIQIFGNEFKILVEADEKELQKNCNSLIANAILNVRNAKVDVTPGYDGVYGKVNVAAENIGEKQLSFF